MDREAKDNLDEAEFKTAQCENKDTFPSRQRADDVARAMRKRGRGNITAYKCDFCRSWHVGGGRKVSKRIKAKSLVVREFTRGQDIPTQERVLKSEALVFMKTEVAGRRAAKFMDSAPIDRLENGGVLNNDQASAGRQFERLYLAQNETGGIRDSCTIWEPKGHDETDGPVKERKQYLKLCRHLGMIREQRLRWVCVQHNHPKGREIGALREALNECVRFFK
jgi:hypothetical protein